MRLYITGFILVVLILVAGCNQPTTPSASAPEDYVWAEPNSRFTVTIPGGFYYSGEVYGNNGHSVTYYFRNADVKRYYTLWWADTTVVSFNTLDEAVRYYITLFVAQGASPPLINITYYADGVYWAQKFDKTSQTILFFLLRDPQGNTITYDYIKPYSEGELTQQEIDEMLPYFASFKF